MVSQKGNMTVMENCNVVFALLVIFKTYEKVMSIHKIGPQEKDSSATIFDGGRKFYDLKPA